MQEILLQASKEENGEIFGNNKIVRGFTSPPDYFIIPR